MKGRPAWGKAPLHGERMFDADGMDLLTLGRIQVLKGKYAEALRSFQEALQVLAFDGELVVHPQFLSHYGAALAAAGGRREEGRKLCERSIQLEPYEAEHYLNLGLVHQMAGDRSAAFWAFNQGLNIRPDHPALLAERRKLERRRVVCFSSLPRNHLLNRCLGKILSATGVRGRS